MRIHFERTGGFTGIPIATTIDCTSLPPEDERKLRELLDAVNFFELPEDLLGQAEGVDRFVYVVTVEMEGRRHTARLGDSTVSPTLRPLIRWLTNAARKTRQFPQT